MYLMMEKKRKISRIVVHCTATLPTATVSSLRAGWRARGWKRPGYHYVVLPDGGVEELLPVGQVANGARGYNADSVHVAYLGGLRRPVPGGPLVGADTRTAEQRSALRALVGELRGALGDLPVVGHRDLSPDRDGDGRVTPREWVKLCPCFDVATEL